MADNYKIQFICGGKAQINSFYPGNLSIKDKGRERVLKIARFLWIIATLILLVTFIAGIKPRFNELRQVCPPDSCTELFIGSEEKAVLEGLGLTMEDYAIFQIALEIIVNGGVVFIGFFLFWRKPDDGMAIFISFTLILFGLTFMVESDAALVRLYPAFSLPLAYVTTLAGVSFVLLFYLFPDGRFIPGWTKYPAIVFVIMALGDPLIESVGSRIPSGQFSLLYTVFFLFSLILGIFSQVYRYRKVSTLSQRQQTKWIMFGLSLLVIPITIWTLFIELFPLPAGSPRLILNTLVFSGLGVILLFFPLTIIISITRYRLWDIDIIINRTLTYSLLSGFLVFVYFGSVTIIQRFFTAVSGTTTPLAIVISTLLIAALFNPLRARIQDVIDRRFFRKKYDARQVLARFSQTVRDETDMESLIDELIHVVEETMQSEEVFVTMKVKQ